MLCPVAVSPTAPTATIGFIFFLKNLKVEGVGELGFIVHVCLGGGGSRVWGGSHFVSFALCKVSLSAVQHLKDVDGMANSVDPEEQCDLCLHCLLRPICHST